jgi:hypothetical protein
MPRFTKSLSLKNVLYFAAEIAEAIEFITVLEVADSNAYAVSLYQISDFVEVCRVSEKQPKQSGINYYLYMYRVRG